MGGSLHIVQLSLFNFSLLFISPAIVHRESSGPIWLPLNLALLVTDGKLSLDVCNMLLVISICTAYVLVRGVSKN